MFYLCICVISTSGPCGGGTEAPLLTTGYMSGHSQGREEDGWHDDDDVPFALPPRLALMAPSLLLLLLLCCGPPESSPSSENREEAGWQRFCWREQLGRDEG